MDAGASVDLIFGPLGGGRPGGEEVAAAGTGECGGRAARGRCAKLWCELYIRSGIGEPSGLLVLMFVFLIRSSLETNKFSQKQLLILFCPSFRKFGLDSGGSRGYLYLEGE